MQIRRRIFGWAMWGGVLGAAACSNEAEWVLPEREPDTVIIGCVELGADIETRTSLGEDGLSVQWTAGDGMRLWARESGAGSFLSQVQDVPFRFDYFSPSWSRAGFTGMIDSVETTFDEAKTYDYFALAPVSAETVLDGTFASCEIPAAQNGAYDASCDILTARLLGAVALKPGDNNPTINLPFEHHIHLLKFTIPSNGMGDEPVEAVELTFPRPVAGTLRVDATGAAADDTSGLDQTKIQVEFPRGEAKRVGDSFYVTIAPIAFEPGESIGMRFMAEAGEASIDYTFAAARTLAAGHTTPFAVHVPEMDTYFTTIAFLVTDSDTDNRLGVNTLGERLTEVRLTGLPGAFSNAVRISPSQYSSVSADGSQLVCTIPDETEQAGFDGVYALTFVSRKDATSKCPYEAWDSSLLSAQPLEVEYESPRALIKSLPDWDPITVAVPAVQSLQTTSAVLNIPYLFTEDFSRANGINVSTGNETTGERGTLLNSQNFHSPNWSGYLVLGSTGSIRLTNYYHFVLLDGSNYHGRLDSSNILNYIKDGVSEVGLHVEFDYSDYTTRNDQMNSYTCVLGYEIGKRLGYDESSGTFGVVDPFWERSLSSGGNSGNDVRADEIILHSGSSDVSTSGTVQKDLTCEVPARISWQIKMSGYTAKNWSTFTSNVDISISNVKVSLR